MKVLSFDHIENLNLSDNAKKVLAIYVEDIQRATGAELSELVEDGSCIDVVEVNSTETVPASKFEEYSADVPLDSDEWDMVYRYENCFLTVIIMGETAVGVIIAATEETNEFIELIEPHVIN